MELFGVGAFYIFLVMLQATSWRNCRWPGSVFVLKSCVGHSSAGCWSCCCALLSCLQDLQRLARLPRQISGHSLVLSKWFALVSMPKQPKVFESVWRNEIAGHWAKNASHRSAQIRAKHAFNLFHVLTSFRCLPNLPQQCDFFLFCFCVPKPRCEHVDG